MTSITDRYRFKLEIGRGAYGSVWSARAIEGNDEVAIKKIFGSNFEQIHLTKRALRELKILRHLNGHDNIAKFVDCGINSSYPSFTELYLVEGLMEADLNQILRSAQKLTNQHFQYFLYQMLRGLKYIHSAGIIHRDLKPGNLLVNSNCELRICDFGLARGLNAVDAHLVNTEYVATRFYRAPEVVLSPKHYSKSIDTWSVGCIFGEMLCGSIVFKGADYIDQLSKIFDVLGTPQDSSLTKLCTMRVMRYLRTWPKRQKANLRVLFPKGDAQALDLLDKLLAFDPEKRITAAESLKHPYLSTYHIPDDEPDHERLFDFSFESASTIDQIKCIIAKEVDSFVKNEALPAAEMAYPKRTELPSGAQLGDGYPKREEETAADGADSVEAEILMKGLKIDE